MSNVFLSILPYIVGVGGWSGVVAGSLYYLNGERLTLGKLEEIIALPLLGGLTGGLIAAFLYIGTISAFVTIHYILSSMRHPGTLLFTLLVIWIYIGIEYGILTPLRIAFLSEAEVAAAEIAADNAVAVAAAVAEETEEGEEAEDTEEAEEAEETEEGEEAEEAEEAEETEETEEGEEAEEAEEAEEEDEETDNAVEAVVAEEETDNAVEAVVAEEETDNAVEAVVAEEETDNAVEAAVAAEDKGESTPLPHSPQESEEEKDKNEESVEWNLYEQAAAEFAAEFN